MGLASRPCPPRGRQRVRVRREDLHDDPAGQSRIRDEAIRAIVPEFGPGYKSKIVLPNMVAHDTYAVFSLVVQAPSGMTKKVRLPLNSYLGIPDTTVKAQYYAALAYLYFRKQDLDQALSMCEKGLKIAGSVQYDAPHDELTWLKGLIELERHNMPAARQALGQLRTILHSGSINAMNYKPAYKYYLHLLAKISAEDGKINEATIAINDLKWIKLKLGYWSTPFDQAFFFDAIGQICEKIGRLPEAEQAYRDALSYNPNYGLARFHFAKLLKDKGSLDDARREVEVFLAGWSQADPDTAEVVEAKKILKLSR